MNEFNFNYDFSRLSAVGLQKSKITQREIISVFENLKGYQISGFVPSENYFAIIGYGLKSRFLFVTLSYTIDRIVFHQVIIANETQIQNYYCSK